MLCTLKVCDVTLCSHSVPSEGFNSLPDTQAKNRYTSKEHIALLNGTNFMNLVEY
ncbi:MAG TPA: hypothetical protein VJ772_09905 [Nitrososphaeraceae archaeon]|nr:hypothetical protein [Nitrososphaeraceae archaeon]